MIWKTVSLILRMVIAERSAHLLRNKGLLLYLKALQVLRLSLTGGLLLFVTIQIMVMSAIGLLVVGTLLLPQDYETKLWILFVVFMTFTLIPGSILAMALSNKMWLRASGVEKILSQETDSNSHH